MSSTAAPAKTAPHQLRRWLEEGHAVPIDVREPAESAGEGIPGSRRHPLSSFEPTGVSVEAGKTAVLYCRSGRRSAEAAAKLLRAGWEKVHHLEGGIEAWKAAGGPLVGDGNAAMPLERQVRIVAGSLVLASTVLGALTAPWLTGVAAFVGAGLIYAGITDSCGMALMLARLPYNQRRGSGCDRCA
jgi:rhodanese-related sulfurtransferase